MPHTIPTSGDSPLPPGGPDVTHRIIRPVFGKTGLIPAAALTAMLFFSVTSYFQARTASLTRETARAAVELSMHIAEARLAGNLFAPYPEPRLFAVTVTAYSPTPDQTWGDPWTGAMGRRVRPGKTLAVSHDLKHLLGSRVYVQDVGYLVAEDLMHPRWENRVDLCMRTRDRAEAFGVKQLNMVVLD